MLPHEIQSLRQAREETRKEFAEALGFKSGNPYQLVKRWEEGLRKPSMQTIMLMQQMQKKIDRKLAK